MSRKAVIIGAGALGLGFLAERLAGDYALCLADIRAKETLLHRIEADQGFELNLCRLDGIRPRHVTGSFTVAFTDDPSQGPLDRALAEADLVLTATNVKVLDQVMSRISEALNKRAAKAWLLFCENGRHAATYAPRFGHQTVLVDTVMSRMCRFGDPSERGYKPLWSGATTPLVVEDYDYLPLDAGLCPRGPFGPVFSLVPHAEFDLWEDIKVFLHNGMHAYVSYRAFLEGVKRFPDTPQWIRKEARRVMRDEVIAAIVRTHRNADREQILRYGSNLLDRFFNPYFNDSIERGVRDVEEKLAPGERLEAGCEYIRRAGIEPRGYAGTIDAAREILTRQSKESSDQKHGEAS
jgi:mannitol-1-phosphate/altronate dehydrogenase